jgi:hypothetical protein
MANANGSIDEIIGQEAIKQIDDATAKMGTLLTTFKESVTAVNLMNDALNKAGSGGSGGLKSNTTAINEQEKALKALIKANEDAGKEYIQLQQLTKQQTAANRLDAQSANASKGSYNELQANMSLLIAKYKSLSAEMRSGAIGKGLQADIAMANKSLKDLDSGLGNMQRNVGNYGSALSKVWGGIRQIAYILPGLGIAGIFNLAGEAIMFVAEKLDIFNSKVSKSQEIFKEAFSGTGYKSAIENVYTLKENIDLANKGLISKDAVLKEYNETLGKTTGHLSTWNQLENLSINGLPNYIKMVSLKEEAQAALNKAIQKTTELNQVGNEVSFMDKMTSRIEGYMRDFNKMSGFGKTAQQISLVPIIQRLFGSEAEKDLTEYLDRLKIKTGVSIDEFTLLFRKKQEEAAALAKKNKFNFTPTKDPTAAKPVNRIDDIKKQMDDEIAVAKVKASEEYKTENELRQDILEIYKKYATKKLVAVKNLNKDEEHSSKQLGEQIVKDTQSIVEKQTAEINKQIKNDIDQHNRALKVKIKNNDERVKDEEKACADIDKAGEEAFKKQQDRQEKDKKQREDDQKALMDAFQSMANSTFDIANSISDAIFAKQMQQFDAQDKALKSYYDNELKFIESSGFSNEKKEKMKAKLAAETEAKQKQIDRERVTALRKQAKLQKALDINQAVASTALAVLKALGDKTIETPYLRIANAIAAGLIGAAQIARVIATPLPQYAKGRKGGKAEHAIVGEIGQEAIVTTDGKVTLTPSTPSLAYIPQGADVIPHNELIKNSAYVALAKQGTVTTDKLQMALIAEFERNTEKIDELISVTKSKNLTATYNGLGAFESYKQANIR